MNDHQPTALTTRAPALSISHIAERNRCYPGDTITLYTRVDVRRAAAGLTTRVTLPDGAEPGRYAASPSHGERVPDLVYINDERFLVWTIEGDVTAGTRLDYEVQIAVCQTEHDLTLDSEAIATLAPLRGAVRVSGDESAKETASVIVEAKGHYLKYLPAIYSEQDELMGRFLMLFESFWKPIEQQIDHIPYYFDPDFIPGELLPWLAAWVDLTLNDNWPEEKRRRLIREAVFLFRKRGTKVGLAEYLEIYTGSRPQIIEHRAHNFVLGMSARLGPGVALGRLNTPHTFTIKLQLPPMANGSEIDTHRLEWERRRTIEAIIESEKPAHTTYTLDLEVLQE
jgi:phage tail-like protein